MAGQFIMRIDAGNVQEAGRDRVPPVPMYHRLRPPVLHLAAIVLEPRLGYTSDVAGMASPNTLTRWGPGPLWKAVHAVLAMLLLTACSTSPAPAERPLGHLTASLRVSHGLEMSRLSYEDACGSRRDFALGPALEAAFRETVTGVFHGEPAPGPSAPSQPVDRRLEIDVDAAELIVFVEEDTTRHYPIDVSLAVMVTAYDASGILLDRHRLGADVGGSVSTERERCRVSGVERIATEAVGTLAEELGRYLRGSRSIAMGTRSPGSPAPSAELTFRARLLDADGDRVLEGNEEVTLEVEVTNVGTESAREVRSTLSGSRELVGQLPPVIAFGDVGPGESKRQTVTARLGEVGAAGQAELVLSITSRSALRRIPASKKFLIMLEPKQTVGRTPSAKPLTARKAFFPPGSDSITNLVGESPVTPSSRSGDPARA